MKTGWSTRRVAASLGIAAIISMGALTACGSEKKRGSIRNINHHNDFHVAVGEPDGEGAAARSQRTEPVLARRQGAACADRPSRRQLAQAADRTERASQRLARSLLSGAKDMMWAIAALSDVCIRRGSCAVWDSR